MAKMTEQTRGTMERARKGPIAPPPCVAGVIGIVAETVANWPGVITTAHWDLYDSSRIDGIDFYVGEDELGHIHLEGSIHLATNPSLGKSLIVAGFAQRFPYASGWVQQNIGRIGSTAAVALFQRNYERLLQKG